MIDIIIESVGLDSPWSSCWTTQSLHYPTSFLHVEDDVYVKKEGVSKRSKRVQCFTSFYIYNLVNTLPIMHARRIDDTSKVSQNAEWIEKKRSQKWNSKELSNSEHNDFDTSVYSRIIIAGDCESYMSSSANV